MRHRLALLFIIAVIALPGGAILSGFVSTHRSMAEFRTTIVPGMTLAELLSFAGKPEKILRKGEPLRAARRSYTVPALDDHTALYFYPRSGTPYYNVYVFIDERENKVVNSHVENLGW